MIVLSVKLKGTSPDFEWQLITFFLFGRGIHVFLLLECLIMAGDFSEGNLGTKQQLQALCKKPNTREGWSEVAV